MAPQDKIVVRQADDTDIDALIGLEKRVYGPLGTACYGRDHFEAWRRVHPAGLLVAVCGDQAVGYQYAQLVEFGFDRLHLFRTYDQVTDHGYTAASHRPDGNTMHSISLCSALPGAGRAILAAMFGLARKLGTKYTIGMTRMAGFDAYMRQVEAAGPPASQDQIALWYALETARLVQGLVWPSAGPAPSLVLPALPKPDPVVGKQLRFRQFGLAAILPNCMPDPQSRDYAALLVGESSKIH